MVTVAALGTGCNKKDGASAKYTHENPHFTVSAPSDLVAGTFGDYLLFHPHLHILAADGLFDKEGRFHTMPAEDLAPVTEIFRHRFLHALRDGIHLSARKVADLLSWKHSGFHIDSGGEKPVAPHDTEDRKRLAEYLLRAPFSLQKITWNPDTKTVKSISETDARSSWNTPDARGHRLEATRRNNTKTRCQKNSWQGGRGRYAQAH